MDYLQLVLKILAALFLFIVILKIYMNVAAYIGEQFGFGKLFVYLWEKVRKR